ncbi:MAG: LolA family protein [Bacillota bacterium]|jgi:outer membrane lipoprotein-sorting protein
MKKTKYLCLKNLFLWLLIGLLSIALIGCGGGSQNTNSQPPNSSQPDTQQNAPPANDDSPISLLAKAKQIEGMSYDYTYKDKSNTINGKFWVQGHKTRMETTVEGQTVVTIYDGVTMYNYMAEEDMAIKITPDQSNLKETPLDYTEDIDTKPDKYKIVDSTVYDGVTCKVVVITTADGKEECKMWVREDYGIPIRIEVDSQEGKAVMEFKNLQIGPQPAEKFQLPAGVQVMDMTNMLNQIPQQ